MPSDGDSREQARGQDARRLHEVCERVASVLEHLHLDARCLEGKDHRVALLTTSR